jgi:hypothetical protein
MSTHDQYNIRQELQQLKEVPIEFAFDATRVWQKMEAKLQPEKQRRSYVIWWSAAAMLLLIGMTAVIYNNGTKNRVAPAIAIKNEVEYDSPKVQPKLSTASKAALSTIRKKEPILWKPLRVSETNVEDSATIYPQTPIVETPVILTTSPEIVANTIQPVSAPVKKPRLKVVHINDLYKPVPEEIAKAEIKNKTSEEIAVDTEPLIITPPRSFWKSKAPQKTAIALNDNP